MTKADELWEKYYSHARTITRQDFLAALAEYGQAVRDMDAEICIDNGKSWQKHTPDVISPIAGAAAECALAISREPIP